MAGKKYRNSLAKVDREKYYEIDATFKDFEAKLETYKQEKIEIKENIELQSQKVYDDYVSRARERAKRNDAIALAKANEKLEASKVKHQEAMAEMKKHYEKNKDIWVDELVNRVIQ